MTSIANIVIALQRDPRIVSLPVVLQRAVIRLWRLRIESRSARCVCIGAERAASALLGEASEAGQQAAFCPRASYVHQTEWRNCCLSTTSSASDYIAKESKNVSSRERSLTPRALFIEPNRCFPLQIGFVAMHLNVSSLSPRKWNFHPRAISAALFTRQLARAHLSVTTSYT